MLDKIVSIDSVKNYGTTYIVENPRKASRYHIAYKNSPYDKIARLDMTPNEFGVITEIAKRYHKNLTVDNGYEFELNRDHITYVDNDKYVNYYGQNRIKADFRVVPEKLEVILGADEIGRYYNKQENIMLLADHYKVNALPCFHKDIHSWIEQHPIDTKWFQQYLSIVRDMDKSVPWIHCYGRARSGKTLLANLVSTLWSSKQPDKDFFKNDTFQDKTGSNPVISMEESIPDNLNLLKEMITSNKNCVNKKHQAAIDMVGYPRLMSSINSDDPNFNLRKISDIDALQERVQLAYFEEKHHLYMYEELNVSQISSWLDGRFAEYVAWCEENIEKPVTNDVIAIRPYQTEHFKFNALIMSGYHQRVIEEAIQVINNQNYDAGFFGFDSKRDKIQINIGFKFIDHLMNEKIIKTRMSARDISLLMSKAFKTLNHKRSKDARWCEIDTGDFAAVCEDVELVPSRYYMTN